MPIQKSDCISFIQVKIYMSIGLTQKMNCSIAQSKVRCGSLRIDVNINYKLKSGT